jgi:uracil-DNA glycosylase family 4
MLRQKQPMSVSPADPPHDCALCPRLHQFIAETRRNEASWFNAPVPTFLPRGGLQEARLLVVGLAPGLRGANRTGRPFTGDYAGDLLYRTLIRFGFAKGDYQARPDDGLELVGAAITNAVRCVPPQNKPLPSEINACRAFLTETLGEMPKLRAIVTLGVVSHQSTVKALGGRIAACPFKHGADYDLDGVRVFPSYHCSRYNTNTGVLTEDMFVDVFSAARAFLDIC